MYLRISRSCFIIPSCISVDSPQERKRKEKRIHPCDGFSNARRRKNHETHKKTLNHRLLGRIRSDWYDRIQPSTGVISIARSRSSGSGPFWHSTVTVKYTATAVCSQSRDREIRVYINIYIYLSQMQRHFNNVHAHRDIIVFPLDYSSLKESIEARKNRKEKIQFNSFFFI